MCIIWKKTLFFTLILGLVFDDYVIFKRIASVHVSANPPKLPHRDSNSDYDFSGIGC